MAVREKPWAAKRAENRSNVSGLTGSAPLNAHPPASEIQTLDVLVRNPAQAQIEGEVGCARQGAAIPVHGPKPALRPGEERQRRHNHERDRVVHAAEPGADQSHVVVERQPAHEDVPGAGVQGLGHGADVGEQVGVRQHHPLRIAGAAGRVLKQRHVRGGDGRSHHRSRGSGRQLVEAHHRAQSIGERSQQVREPLCLGRSDHDPRPAVRADGGVPADMLFHLRRAAGRVDRDGHAAGDQHPEEAREILRARRQHDHHRFAAAELQPLEARRGFVGQRAQASVGDGLAFIMVVVEADVRPVGMGRRMPVEHLDEGLGGVWDFRGLAHLDGGHLARRRHGACAGAGGGEDRGQ